MRSEGSERRIDLAWVYKQFNVCAKKFTAVLKDVLVVRAVFAIGLHVPVIG
jgi:hypothetical protein